MLTDKSLIIEQAFGLLREQSDLFRMADDMNRHFTGSGLDAAPRDQVPGLVLRWLHCACDLELWQEAFKGLPAPGDLDRTLDFIARLEDIGIEPVGEQRCIDCVHRKQCL
jgi:hypothetical protein